MKISQEEIDAALSAFNAFEFAYREGTQGEAMEVAIAAALMVRKQRKAAKRERQRKEKGKQVVESVQRRADMSGPELKLAIEKAMHVAFSTPPPFLDSSTGLADPALSATSKAPEWDGTFKAGEYQMRNGEKAIIDHIDGIHLCGKLSPDGLDCCFKWELSSGENNRVSAFDLIRPWPKGEQ